MSTTNIDPRWADIDFDKVNAELRDLRAQGGRLQAHIDRTQPVVAGADGYVQPQAQGEAIAWEATTPVYTKYVTDKRYRSFSDAAKRWYKPYKCSSCQAQATEPAQGGPNA